MESHQGRKKKGGGLGKSLINAKKKERAKRTGGVLLDYKE
jgi:hypothetical protein